MATKGQTFEKARVKREKRQAEYLKALAENDGHAGNSLEQTGIPRSALERWRKNDPEFRRRYDRVRHEALKKAKLLRSAELIYNPKRRLPEKPPFRQWRPIYTGRPVLSHQEYLVDAWEDRTNLRVLCFMPPGAGKDTTAMDLIMYDGCDDWTLRQAWLMESEGFSKRRVKERLAPYLTDSKTYLEAPAGPGCTTPTRSLIDDYGPFKWEPGMIYPDGEPVPRPTWNASEIYFLPRGAPESEPNLWATGIQGTLYGARVRQMVLSDPFTMENQGNAKTRGDQMNWLYGTMESRLDADGRLLLINTRVGDYDNQGKLLREMTENARIIYQSEDGFYTKYSNGTATVIIPAIQTDDEGNEVSYWEDMFPLDGQFVMPDGDIIYVDDLSTEEIQSYTARGARRRLGLREMRRRKPKLFAAMWQQQPMTSEHREFTQALLDHCDDPSRSIGQVRPGEILIGGVDPARKYGAAWVIWAYHQRDETVTVVDYFFGRELGTHGIREKLLRMPVIEYLPRYLCWEINKESAVLDHPDVISVLNDTKTELIRHQTGHGNRNLGEDAVATMAEFMRDKTIRFPAALPQDREKMELFKQHFQNWDENESQPVKSRPGRGGHQEDDICLAAWVGWVKVREMMRRQEKRGRRRWVPKSVLHNWGMKPREQHTGPRLSTDGNGSKPITDLEAAYHGGHDDEYA